MNSAFPIGSMRLRGHHPSGKISCQTPGRGGCTDLGGGASARGRCPAHWLRYWALLLWVVLGGGGIGAEGAGTPTELLFSVKVTGRTNQVLQSASGRVHRIVMNLSGWLYFRPQGITCGTQLFNATTANVSGAIRYWGSATATGGGGGPETHEFDHTRDFEWLGEPVDTEFEPNPAKYFYIETRGTRFVAPDESMAYAFEYVANLGVVRVWIALPSPFSYDSALEHYDFPATHVTSGGENARGCVYGTVIDGLTHKELPGAQVTLGGVKRTADTKGAVVFQGLPPSEANKFYAVAVTNAPYLPLAERLELKPFSIVNRVYEMQAPAELAALEVAQVVQDWRNSVPLIEGKKTYVRAHVQLRRATDGPFEVKDAVLSAKRSGAPLNPEQPPIEPLVVRTGVTAGDARSDWHGTLNFLLPPDWTRGDVELEFKASGVLPRKYGRTGAREENGRVAVKFEPMPRVPLHFSIIHWRELLGREHAEGTLGDAYRLLWVLEAMFPVSSLLDRPEILATTKTVLDWSEDGAAAFLTDLSIELETYRQKAKEKARSEWGGLVYGGVSFDSNTLPGGLLGLASGIGRRSDAPKQLSWAAVGVIPKDWTSSDAVTHGHELGHVLGLEHTAFGTPKDDPKLGPVRFGTCNEVVGLSSMNDWSGRGDFPHWSIVPGAESRFSPTLGPMLGGEDQLVYGLDTSMEILGGRFEPRVADPVQFLEVMSYCTNPGQWVSGHTYSRLMALLRERFGGSNLALQDIPRAADDHILVRGNLRAGGEAVDLRPVLRVRMPPETEGPEVGEYAVTVTSLGGGSSTVSFSPTPSIVEGGAAGGFGEYFVVPVAFRGDVGSLTISRAGKVLASVRASPHPPRVKVLQPDGGEVLEDGELEVKWDASDEDRDELRFAVQFSDDDGASWKTLVVDWMQTAYRIPRGALKATSRGRIRVQAYDGLNSTEDVSDESFVVGNHAPTLILLFPRPGEPWVGRRQVVFEALADDVEDGRLLGPSIRWTSDLDGLLGEGPTVVRSSESLKEGPHVITVTATDSAGAVTSETVRVEVFREEPVRLRALLGNPGLDVSWPANRTNWVLQATPALGAGAVWQNVTNAVRVEGTNAVVRFPPAAGLRFFRLRQP